MIAQAVAIQIMKFQWLIEDTRIIMAFRRGPSRLEMIILAFLLGIAVMTILPLGSIVGPLHLVTIVTIPPRSLRLVLVNMMITEGVLHRFLTGIAIPGRLLAITEVVILPCQILRIVATLFLRLTMIVMIEGLTTDLELIRPTVPVLPEEEKNTKDQPGLSNYIVVPQKF